MNTRLTDNDIREALRSQLVSREAGDNSGRVLIDELGLCEHIARVDLAILGDALEAFEIKSERDSLRRLHDQCATYSRIFNRVTVVTVERHAMKVQGIVPDWFGISIASRSDSSIGITCCRPAAENPQVEPRALAQLLWRDEAVDLLKERGIRRGVDRATKDILWEQLAGTMSVADLRTAVVTSVRNRADWRPVQRLS